MPHMSVSLRKGQSRESVVRVSHKYDVREGQRQAVSQGKLPVPPGSSVCEAFCDLCL